MDYAQLDDETIVQRIAQQDPAALEALYDRHAQIMYNLIVRIVRDQALADEILQETFWQVWQKAANFSGRGAVAAWLYRIARNKSLDQLRRQKARPQRLETDSQAAEEAMWSQLNAEAPAVERVVERRLTQEQLRAALAELPVDQRRCLELAYFEGLSQRQIAEVTNTPLGTVKTRLRIGLEKLERIFHAAGYRARDTY